jgi:hypothetical protein
MATKKKSSTSKSRKTKKTPLDLGDPPILVGGGGSSYLWVNLDQDQRPVNPSSNNPSTGVNPGSPMPNTRGNYSCSRVSRTPPKISFYDGVNPEVSLSIPVGGRGKWYIKFE